MGGLSRRLLEQQARHEHKDQERHWLQCTAFGKILDQARWRLDKLFACGAQRNSEGVWSSSSWSSWSFNNNNNNTQIEKTGTNLENIIRHKRWQESSNVQKTRSTKKYLHWSRRYRNPEVTTLTKSSWKTTATGNRSKRRGGDKGRQRV